MTRVLLCLLALLCLGDAAFAQGTGEAKRMWFEVKLTPEHALTRGTHVGAQIVIDIRLTSSDPLQRVKLDMPRIEGATVETLIRPHTLQINMFGGRGYSHEAKYAVFPGRDGTLVIPPIGISGISRAGTGIDGQFREEFPEQRIAVLPPEPAFSAANWVVSDNVTLEERWSADLNAIHGGDTVRRTVVVTFSGVRADALPGLELAPNDGYRVLDTDLVTSEERTQDGFVARLEQSWDIFVETDGIFYIDPVRVPYWDAPAGAAGAVEAPRRRVEPVRRDAEALRDGLRAEVMENLWLRRLGVGALLAVPCLFLLAVAIMAAGSALPTRADLRFWRAARRPGTGLDLYRDFQTWGHDALAERAIVGERQAARLGAPAVDEIRRLHRSLFARGDQPVEPRRLSRTLILASIRSRLGGFFAAAGDRVSRLLFPG